MSGSTRTLFVLARFSFEVLPMVALRPQDEGVQPGTLPADGSKITALYARLSRGDGGEEDCGSVPNQEDICQGGFHQKDEIPR